VVASSKIVLTNFRAIAPTNQNVPILMRQSNDERTLNRRKPLRPIIMTMASRLTPSMFRSALWPSYIASRTRCRSFAVTSRVASDALMVVSRSIPTPWRSIQSQKWRQRLTIYRAASRHSRQQYQYTFQVHRAKQKAHRRDPQAISSILQKGGCYAPAGPWTTPTWIHKFECHE